MHQASVLQQYLILTKKDLFVSNPCFGTTDRHEYVFVLSTVRDRWVFVPPHTCVFYIEGQFPPTPKVHIYALTEV